MSESQAPVADAPLPDAAHSQVLGGRYRVIAPIGRDGRSVVYAAQDTLLDREVAVKVFSASARSAADLRVQEAEARLAARLNHHALTTLFDAGIDISDPDRPQIHLVMERVPGHDLKHHLVHEGALTPGQVAELGLDITEGLQHLHLQGFLHRDIKPANVLLARSDIERTRGKLADFGIASIIGVPEDGEYTTGTAAYISPEQVEGRDPTVASDVYALGLVLLEALTGHVAYPGGVEETALARLQRDPDIPATVPIPLASILRRMTALLPAGRPDLDEVASVFRNVFVRTLVATDRVTPDALAAQEEQRLDAVRRYNILDTPPDEAFDRITHLACRLLGVPVAFVSIIDADREWFKSRIGFAVEEIDRDVALCTVTIATGEPMTVEDVQAVPAFAANPIVQADRDLHAFAAVPLRTHDGHVIGTLCVFDRRVRTFTEEELGDLRQLAAVAMRELELRLAGRRILFER